MGLNSIHQYNGDIVECFNETNKTFFKCTIVKQNYSHMQVVQGIDSEAVECVLIVHGNCDVSNRDQIRVPSFRHSLQVVNTCPSYDSTLFRKRIDYCDFTVSMEIALA